MNEMQEGLDVNVESLDVEIDFGRIFNRLLQHAWMIVMISLLGALLMYGISKFILPAEFESTASLYIHDKSVTSTAGGVNIGANPQDGTINYNTIGGNAATYLQNTYKRTLISDTTLNIVIGKLGLEYDSEDLREMIESSVVDYPYFDITVTSESPEEAAKIANELANVLYEQVSKIVGGSSLTHVDEAFPPEEKSAPHTLRNVIIGFVAGFGVACAVVVLLELTNNKIYNDEYLINRYGISVLASITDYTVASQKGSRYYKKHRKYQYYYEQD